MHYIKAIMSNHEAYHELKGILCTLKGFFLNFRLYFHHKDHNGGTPTNHLWKPTFAKKMVSINSNGFSLNGYEFSLNGNGYSSHGNFGRNLKKNIFEFFFK